MEKEKLFEIAGEVYRNVPAYIDLARDRDIDIASLTEFGQLPIMEKKYMIDHEMGNIAPEMIREYMTGNLIAKRTSGSTGQYLEILWSDADYKRSMIELWLRRVQYYDIYPEDRKVYFFTDNDVNTRYDKNSNYMGISKYMLNENDIDEVVKSIVDFKTKWLLLQPSVAVILCSYIKKKRSNNMFDIKYIEFSGEVLTDEVRRLAKNTFKCNIANQYGTNEVNSIAYECPYGNMHIMNSNVFVEIMDDDGNKINDSEDEINGVSGNVVVTSRHSNAMPFIRYNLGDIASIKISNCECGNCNKILHLHSGRQSEYMLFENNVKVSSYILIGLFDSINYILDGAIKQYYVEQKSYIDFYIYICKDEEIEDEQIKSCFMDLINEEHLKKCNYFFEFCTELFNLNSSGKHMYFRSDIIQN